MKGVNTDKNRLRHTVFTEVARLAYEGGGAEELDELPYKIITGESDPFRDSLFLERAIVGERIRAAMGMSLRPLNQHAPTSRGVDESMIEERYYEPPLIDIIQFACHSCPDNRVYITDGCQGCLEHPCREVCPKKCISYDRDLRRNVIDTEKCIKCGMCMKACQYSAIIKQERPCVAACGLGAIGEDEYGHAMINQDKCVSCGMCLNSCPFAAIVDKGQIYQTIKAMQMGTPVYAIVAPTEPAPIIVIFVAIMIDLSFPDSPFRTVLPEQIQSVRITVLLLFSMLSLRLCQVLYYAPTAGYRS